MHECSSGTCTESDCCQQPTCSSFTGTCPEGQTERGAHDMHQCISGTCTESDCCLTTCSSFTGDCGALGTRGGEAFCWSGTCTESECCQQPTCSSFTGTCPEGTTKRRPGDMHECISGTCTESDCCLGGHTGGVTGQWGDSAWAACNLTASWQELARRGKDPPEGPAAGSWRTGGLGALMQSPRYEVWLCERGHPCSGGDDAFCFVYDEQMKVFVPWGRNSQLQLIG